MINPTEEQFSEWMQRYYPPPEPQPSRQRRLAELAQQEAMLADLAQTQDPENAAIMQRMAPQPQEMQPMNTIRSSSGRTISLPSIQEQGGMSLNDLLNKTGARIQDKVIMSDRGEGYRTPYGSVAGLDSNGRMWEMDKPVRRAPTAKQMSDYYDMLKKKSEAEDAMGMPIGGGQDSGGMTTGQASQKFLERKFGKAPEGERWKSDGTLEIIPGGKAEGKEKKEQLLREGVQKQVGTVVGKVEEALPQVSGWTAGMGSLLSKIPGTPARDLEGTVDTIKANIGFKELADMRAASPTGGALGQVAVKELEFLQAAISALDTGQSPDALKRNLNQVKTHYENWKKIMDQHYGSGGPSGRPVAQVRQTADGGNAVTLPDGRTLRFPSGAAAEAFRRKAGL